MPHYVYNVVYNRGGQRQVEPHLNGRQPFPGSAAEFARATLVAWLERNPRLAGDLAIVNVWDADRADRGVPRAIIGRMTTWDLDDGPFPVNQLETGFGWYYVVSSDYVLLDDAVLGMDGREITHGVPYGLVVPGDGPALMVRAGHPHAWITLDAAVLEHEPETDLDAWEAVEQAVVEPTGPVRITHEDGRTQQQWPDLTGGRVVRHLTVRVSVRGRDRPESGGAVHPRRRPVEDHLVQAWPASGPAPRTVLKRDATTRQWESGR